MQTSKVQASLRIRAVSPEPSLFAHTSIAYKKIHSENTPIFKYIENFTTRKKNENFQMKNSGGFHISAQNIDFGYSLEPPGQGGSNEYPQSIFFSRNKKNNI